MSTLTHVESRRLYSWWWDSHISPKNSRWLQENLTDMDSKVKSMIKIINEDADSFARRAEMYYRKRPELMKLVEEFYRAYRALAERYDSATGALRQAQRTITEVFPNQIPFVLDELPSGFSSADVEPHTPDTLPPLSFFDPDGSQKDASTLSSFPGFKRNGAFSDGDDSLSSKKGLKQLHEMFGSGEGVSAPRFTESKVRKGLNFQEEEEDDAFERVKVLQEKLSQLSTENEDLKKQAIQETENKLKTNHELQKLQEAHVALESEKEEALSQFRQSLKRIIDLEAEIEKFKELNANLLLKVRNLDDSEEKCFLLDRENQNLHLEVDTLRQKTKEQQEELICKQEELDKLKLSMQDEHLRCVHAEAALETLESLYSHCQEELKTSSLEIQDGLQKLKDMELSKEALEESMKHVKEENSNLNMELKMKIEELEKLKIAIQDECQRSVLAEAALLSLKKLYAQSQDEVKELACEIQGKTDQLKDLEAKKQFLELEVNKVGEDICTLNEQNFSFQSLINNLQDQILSLKEMQGKLENDVVLHKDENKVLHGELFSLKDEINNLKQRHRQIAVQLEEVGLNGDTLQTSVRDLQDGNIELKEICKKQETEKALLLEKLGRLEKIYEKNALLENSLSDANSELEDLRAKIKALEESCEILHEKNSLLISEKSILASNVEMITQKMGKLLESKVFLENSLSDANVEIEGLRGRLKGLEESCQALHNDKLSLQTEKKLLLSQVERIEHSLSDLQKKYVELHENHSYLEKEKESTQSQISELKDLLKLEKQANIAFMNSNNSRLALLEEQISLLREDGRCRDEEFKNEQLNLLAAQIEISILHRCLNDMKDNNFNLSKECHKMEHNILEHREKEMTLLDQIERLRRGIQMVLGALHANENNKFSNCSEELCFQIILDKIKEMLSSIHGAEDKKHTLEFENSIYITLLHHLGLDSVNLKLEKQHLHEDCQTKSKEVLLLEAENCDLFKDIEELKHVLEENHKGLDILVTQKEDLGKQLLDLKEEQHIKSSENHKLHEQNQLLSSKLIKLTEEMHKLEEAHSAILEHTVTLDCVSLAFKHLSNERAMVLETLNNDLNQSHEIKCDLQRGIKDMAEKIEALEMENFQLRELALKLEECRAHLGIISIDLNMARDLNEELNSHVELLDQRIKSGEDLLIQKDKMLSEAELKFQDLQNQDKDLSYKLENNLTELNETKALVVGLEKQIVTLSKDVGIRDKEIASTAQVKEILDKQLHELHKENDNLKNKEVMLTSALSNNMEYCESEVAALHHELLVATVHASIYEDKLLEAVGKCDSLEICILVERSILHSEITAKTEHVQSLNMEIDSLKVGNKDLKSELDGYLPILSCLDNSISSLEKYILPLRDCPSPTCHEMKDCSTEELTSGGQIQRDDQRGKAPGGVMELQKLLTKVEELREVLESSNGRLLHASSGAKSKHGKERKNDKERKQFHENTGPGKGFYFQICDGERNTDKDGLMMKDIQLDHISNSSRYDFSDDTYGMSALDGSETNDQMLELWETAENHSNNKKGKSPFISGGHDIEYQNIEAVEEEKSEYPSSELIAEKELGIDKLEVQKTGRDSHQNWSKNVAERLSSDAQRLSALHKSMQELKQKMEKTEEVNHPKSFEYDTVKMQLQDAEESVLKLANLNKKLMKDAEACSRSPANNEDPEGVAYQQKRQVSKRARRGSEKIGRLELELQKLQYILLKLEEEFENMRSKAAERKSRVILRDYLYGRRDKDGKRKKGRLCGCMRPRTKGD